MVRGGGWLDFDGGECDELCADKSGGGALGVDGGDFGIEGVGLGGDWVDFDGGTGGDFGEGDLV